MGCRTGFYLLLTGNYSSEDIVPLLKEMFSFIASYTEDVPGASPVCCGNYLEMEYFAFKARLVLILDRGGWYIIIEKTDLKGETL